MLTIQLGGTESYDETTQQFVTEGGTSLDLEHSLLSLSKWEAIYEKPFLGREEKTSGELISYIRCMALDSEIPPEVFLELSEDNAQQINNYLNAKQTATWFSERQEQRGSPRGTGEQITSELIYYWMTAFRIPFECETWHLNRLFTLIRICNIKQESNSSEQKMTPAEIAQRNRELNEQRKRQLGTTG